MRKIYKNFISGSFVLLLFTSFLYSGSTFDGLKTSAQKNQKIVKLGKDILKSIRDGEFNSYKLHLLKTGKSDVPARITPLAKSSSTQNSSSETLVEKWESNAWVKDALHLDTYSDDGTYIEGISQDWDGSAWVNTWKISFTYVGGNLAEMIDQQWIGGAWVNSMKFIWVYDGNGNNTKTTMQMWESDAWLNTSQTIDTYDSNQYLIISEDKTWDAGTTTWVDFYLTTYTNNGSGNPTESLDKMWSGTEWTNISKSAYSYNGSGLLSEQVDQDWDGADWVNYRNELHTYNNSQRKTEWISQDWDGADWINDTRREYTYSENLKIESLRQTWEGTQWVNIRLTKYTYDDQNVLTVMLMQNWENNDWVNDSRWTITYDGTAIDDLNPLIPSEMQLSQNYPNPFNPETNIRFELSQSQIIRIKVFNTSGQLIKTLTKDKIWTAGAHEIQWDGTDNRNNSVVSGLYIYRLESVKNIITKKCLLVK